MRADKCVVFCATQRTGSTLVFDDFLNVVGSPRKGSEILYRRIVAMKTQAPWSELWNEVSQLNNVHEHVVIKVMFHYTSYISRFIERNSTADADKCGKFIPEVFDAFYNFFADAVWVYVERRNVFAQAVSMYLAERTKVWEKIVGRPMQNDTPVPDVTYDYKKLKPYLQGFLAEREQWQLFFGHYKIAPIRINYEEAAAGYPQYLKELLDKTGLKPMEAPRARRMIKLGDQRNEAWADFLRNDVIAESFYRSHIHA